MESFGTLELKEVEEFSCPDCCVTRKFALKKHKTTLFVKNKQMTIDYVFYKCNVCGCDLETPQMLDENLKIIMEDINRK